jgi:hypothetical protein
MVLRDHHEALVEEELEDIVVHPHQKTSSLEVWSPVANGVDEADKLPFIGGEGAVMRHDEPAEIGHWMFLLDEHRPKNREWRHHIQR